MLLGTGVLDRVADAVEAVRRAPGPVALIADEVEMAGPNGEVKSTLAVKHLRRVTLPGRVVADEATLARATAASEGAAVVLSVGSGTIADIGKAVSARLDLPNVVVQTAASVNGFSDDQSVLLVDGVKRTTPTRWPDRLLIDLDVIAQAPVELNRAGLGDLLATYTAPADWRLAQLVGQDDSYDAFAVALARDHVDAVLEPPTRSTAASPTRSSACARRSSSAGSRWVSPGGPRRARGSSTRSATCWRWPAPGRCTARRSARSRSWPRCCGRACGRSRTPAGCARCASRPPPRWSRACVPHSPRSTRPAAPATSAGAATRSSSSAGTPRATSSTTLWERWPDAEFDGLLASPERLVAALRAARAPVRLTQLEVRDTTARWALANGHLMRDRFTVADLAFFMGIWEAGDVDALLVAAARLGAGL